MLGISKIVEEVLLIAIVILLILGLYFLLGNWFSKNQNTEIHSVLIQDCVYDKSHKVIRLRLRNSLDETVYNMNIQIYNSHMDKISEIFLKELKPNQVKTLTFPINDTTKYTSNLRVEFNGVNIPGKEIECREISG